MSFFQKVGKIMAGYRLSGEGYTDEENESFESMCKDMLADIDEFLKKRRKRRRKNRKKKKERKGNKEQM